MAPASDCLRLPALRLLVWQSAHMATDTLLQEDAMRQQGVPSEVMDRPPASPSDYTPPTVKYPARTRSTDAAADRTQVDEESVFNTDELHAPPVVRLLQKATSTDSDTSNILGGGHRPLQKLHSEGCVPSSTLRSNAPVGHMGSEFKRKTCVVKLDGCRYTIGRFIYNYFNLIKCG